MQTYIPDNWVVLKFSTHYRVLAGWTGDYVNPDSWQLNSGILSVEETEDCFLFHGYSGSVYQCNKNRYGIKMNTNHIYEKLVQQHNAELLNENSNWKELIDNAPRHSV